MLRNSELGPIGKKLISLNPESGTTVIQSARVIDGTGSSPREPIDIMIEGERITQVQESGAGLPAGDHVRVIDATGKTVMPGMIDVHVHMLGDQTYDSYRRYLWPSEGVKLIHAARAAYLALEAGWTTFVELGRGEGLELRAAIQDNLICGPRILTATTALSQTGGHADWHNFPYDWIKEKGWRGTIVDGPDECRRAVRFAYREGANLIKVFATSGGVGSPRDWPPHAVFGLDELTTIVNEAREHKMTVAAHSIGGPGARKAIAAGIRSIEHGVIGSADFDVLGLMAEKDMTLVPTLSIMHWFSTKGQEKGMTKWGTEMAEKMLDMQFPMLRKAREEGVRIAVGTDTGTSFGIGLNALELELLVKAGYTPLEAITSATRNSAECRGIDDDVGTLEAGKLADILVLDIDPLADISQLQNKKHIVTILQSQDPLG